jgi:hypothetical protein
MTSFLTAVAFIVMILAPCIVANRTGAANAVEE